MEMVTGNWSHEGGGSLDIEDVLGVLQDPLCRHCIHCFMQEGSELDIDYLLNDLDASAQEELLMFHQAVPKLEEKGIVDFDPPSGKLMYHSDELLEKYAQLVFEDENRSLT